MIDPITALWRKRTAPAHDGLYRVGGPAYAVEVDGPQLSWFDLGPELDLAHVLADPGDVLSIDISARADLPVGAVVCGEGALGSEGFFARLDASGELVWIVALPYANPFHLVRVEGSRAVFVNNHGNSVTVDLDRPEFAG